MIHPFVFIGIFIPLNMLYIRYTVGLVCSVTTIVCKINVRIYVYMYYSSPVYSMYVS